MTRFSLHMSRLNEAMTLQFHRWMVIDVVNTMLKGYFQIPIFTSRYKHLINSPIKDPHPRRFVERCLYTKSYCLRV